MTTNTNTASITSRKFGIELEFKGVTLSTAATATGAIYEGYNHTVRNHWKIVSDASVFGGGELVSPPLSGESGLENASAITAALQASGATVDKQCGFHVHIDATDLSLNQIRNVVKTWARYEDAIKTVLSPSRRAGNQYCRSVFAAIARNPTTSAALSTDLVALFAALDAATTIQQLADVFGPYNARYFMINLQSYFRHRTIEFRCHQGTVEAEKVEMWTRFCLYLVESAASLKFVPPLKDTGKFGLARVSTIWAIRPASIPTGLRDWFNKRAKKFSSV